MILITGGMGFIGLQTARRFLDAGESVVITHYQTWREPDFLREEYGKRVQVERVDATDGDALLAVVRRHGVTGIVHLVVPGLGALSPAEDFRVNTTSLLSVLEAAREAGVRRTTLASSITTYAGLLQGPFREDALLPVASTNPTEAYKKSEEVLGLHYADRTGIDVVFMRIGIVYGPLYHTMANIPSRMCHAAVKGVAADFSTARDGAPYEEDEADLYYVKDCAAGIQLLQMAGELRHRTYNIGGGAGVTNRELAEAVRRAVPGAQITLQPGRGPQHRPDPYMDLGRIKGGTGYEPAYDVERGVADYIAWLRDHPE